MKPDNCLFNKWLIWQPESKKPYILVPLLFSQSLLNQNEKYDYLMEAIPPPQEKKKTTAKILKIFPNPLWNLVSKGMSSSLSTF